MNEIIGTVTILIAIWVYTHYVINAWKGKITPHPFSWMIWVLLMGVVVAAQISDGAGPGVWSNAYVFFMNIIIAFIALKNGFHGIKLSDKITFVFGMLAIPAWLITDNALYAVLLVCVANTCAFIPTFKKSWYYPDKEPVNFFALNFVRQALSIVALANYSFITVIAPVFFATCNITLVFLLLARRSKISN